jgi:hypothetical protein
MIVSTAQTFPPSATTDTEPCNGSELLVIVCGIPGSGNRLLKRLFQAAGAESFVRHGNNGPKLYHNLIELHPHRIVAVMPVRDWTVNNSSNKWAQTELQKDKCAWVAMQTMLNANIPLRIIGYETLFLYPEESKKSILKWVGLPNIPWPENDYPRDENEKWLSK